MHTASARNRASFICVRGHDPGGVLQGAKAQHKLTQEVLRDRAGQVNRVALDRLLQHTRRGRLQALWETALAEADARLTCCEHASAGDNIRLHHRVAQPLCPSGALLRLWLTALLLRREVRCACRILLYVMRGLMSATATAGGQEGAEQRSAARAVDVVAQMVEYIRGSRVDDYAPLFALSARFSETASGAAEGGVRASLVSSLSCTPA